MNMQYDWGIQSVVDGKPIERIIEKSQVEARDWARRFPKCYKVVRRVSAGPWMEVGDDVHTAFNCVPCGGGNMPAVKKHITRTARRWFNGAYVVDHSIVGTVAEGIHKGEWLAHGCLCDWQDTDLGRHSTEVKARHAVEQWVKDNA
jgi:hypothetical protein